MSDSTWHDQARCLGYPPEILFGFFAEHQRRRERRERIALELCADCPVRAECREAGRDEPFGIWGGTTPEERGFNFASGVPLPGRGTGLPAVRGVPHRARRRQTEAQVQPHGLASHRAQVYG